MSEQSERTIVVEDVYKNFGEVEALKGVDLFVPAGKVMALLGPNGAGKTTLVRVLTTLLKPDQGQATVAGLDVLQDRGHLRQIIGLSGQYAAVDENLTGHENLVMVGRLYHLSRGESKKRAKDLLARFELEDAANRVVKTYSGGMRRRLDLAASLVGRPQILFLDEPTTGLDPRSRKGMWSMIRELVQQGTTLLLTTQYLEEADELADRIAVIDEGVIIAEGTADELKSRVGHDVLELKVTEEEQVETAVELLQSIAVERPQSDGAGGVITLSVPDGAQSLLQAVRQLDEAGVELADLHLRRPSLDDVFLSLTGKPSQAAEETAKASPNGDSMQPERSKQR